MIFITFMLNFCRLKNSYFIYIRFKILNFSKLTLYDILNISIKKIIQKSKSLMKIK
jgi:hypothetical protein